MGVREIDRSLEQWQMGEKDLRRRMILARSVNYGLALTHLLRVGVDPPGSIAWRFCQYVLSSPLCRWG